jgi:hypothetical protein
VDFPLLLDLTGLTEVALRLVPTSQLALVHLHKLADRKVDVGDTAAKTPIPTVIMRYSDVQRLKERGHLVNLLRLFARNTGFITHSLTLCVRIAT